MVKINRDRLLYLAKQTKKDFYTPTWGGLLTEEINRMRYGNATRTIILTTRELDFSLYITFRGRKYSPTWEIVRKE